MKLTLLYWTVNFLPVALLLAIFEIWLEEKHKQGPWGKTAFINPFWEKKMPLPVPFLKYLSRYHGIMFLLVIPILFLISMFVWSKVLNYQMSALSFVTMFVAIWLGNAGGEDFLYFAIMSITGWHEPHALRKVVVEKDMTWFKDWLPPVFGINIPGHWLFCPVGALALLLIRQYWIV